MSLMVDYSKRANKIESKLSDETNQYYDIGEYQVGINKETGEVTYRDRTNHRGNHHDEIKETFPNMTCSNGELRIHVADVVTEILKRMEPVEIAQALWKAEDVRKEFIYCMTAYYSSDDITNKERVEFLHSVKEEVHSSNMRKLVNAMVNIESELGRRSFFYQEVNSANDWLKRVEEQLRDKYEDQSIELPRLKHEERDEKFKLFGTNYQENQAHWRQLLEAKFPAPIAPETPKDPDEVQF